MTQGSPATRLIGAVTLVIGLVTARSGDAQIAVTGPTLMERTAAAGETYHGTIPIRNTSGAMQVVRLSLGDRVEAGGSRRFDPAGSHARSNAGWITLSQTEVTVPPQGSVAVAYTVVVPAGAPPPFGTYWSIVFVEGGKPAELPARGVGVTIRLRHTVQVVTHIGETGEARLAFGQPHVEGRELMVDVMHAGTRACRPSFQLDVFREDGSLVHTLKASRGLLYPSMSVRQRFALPELPPGPYTILLLADVGAAIVQGEKYEIQIR